MNYRVSNKGCSWFVGYSSVSFLPASYRDSSDFRNPANAEKLRPGGPQLLFEVVDREGSRSGRVRLLLASLEIEWRAADSNQSCLIL